MSDHTGPRFVFTLGTGETPTTVQELLGLWRADPAPQVASFSAEAVLAGEGTLWVADLPSDLARANQVMEDAEQRLAVSSQAMLVADARMAAFTQRQRGRSSVSFAASPAELERTEPERNLEQLLLDVSRDPTEVSYGLLDKLTGSWGKAEVQFEAFLEQLTHTLTHYAWVETRGQGQPLVRTVVNWSGDANTVWRSRMLANQTKLHQRTLRLALESRQELLRTLTFVSRSAVRLAKLPVLLGTPGGAVLALPAAWKFIMQVMEASR